MKNIKKISLTNLLIKHSGGLITNKSAAKYVLICLAVVCFILTVVILDSTFNTGVPVTPALDI
jgi:hypothetical protein